MKNKEIIIQDMVSFYLLKTNITKEQEAKTIMKSIYEECIEPYVEIKNSEKYMILKNGFVPSKNDTANPKDLDTL